MKQIWLVRHAQSKSQTGEDSDDLNPELSDLGIRQAKRLINPLKELKIDCILISPLKRAWQTYELSKATAQRAEFDSRVIESDWDIPNYYRDILPVVTPNFAIPDRHNAWLIPVELRVKQLLNDLLSRDEKRFLLFGHWGIFSKFLPAFLGKDCDASSQYVPMDNAVISFLEGDRERSRNVRYWNHCAHVADLVEAQ